VVVYGLVAWLALRWSRHRWRYAVVALATLMAVLTGLSRITLTVHWPSDVLAGAVLGLVWLAATLRITRPARVPAAVAGSPEETVLHGVAEHPDGADPPRTSGRPG